VPDRHKALVEMTVRAAVTGCAFVGDRLSPTQIDQIYMAVEQGLREARREGRIDPRATPPHGTTREKSPTHPGFRKVTVPPPIKR